MKKPLVRYLLLCLLVALLTWGCAGQDTATQSTGVTGGKAGQQQTGQIYKGKVVGKSNKAKTISIQVGKGGSAKTMLVSFDSKTKGLDFANKGHGAIILWQMRNGKPYATEIRPKLTSLPAGVTEISVQEVKDLMDDDANFVLIDSRPDKRYRQAHLPGAISIPVCEMDELIDQLPLEKDRFLIFYCGGPT